MIIFPNAYNVVMLNVNAKKACLRASWRFLNGEQNMNSNCLISMRSGNSNSLCKGKHVLNKIISMKMFKTQTYYASYGISSSA